MYKNIFTWVNAIPRVAKILANSDIQVRYEGEGAYTSVDKDGKPFLINLPTMPSNITQKTLDLTFGFMFHELGHVNHTDFMVAKKHGVSLDSGLGEVFNLLEDTYVEKEVSSAFLEGRQYLNHCREFVLQFAENLLQTKLKKQDKVCVMIVPKIRYLSGQDEFENFIKQNPCPELDFLDKYQEEIKNISSTQQSFDLAVKIYEELKDYIPEKPKQQGGGDSQQDESQQNDSGGSQGGNQGQTQLDKSLKKATKALDAFQEIRAQGTEDKTNKSSGQQQNQKPSGPCIILKDFSKGTYIVANRSADEFWEIPSDYNSNTMQDLTPKTNILGMQQKLIRLFAAKNKTHLQKSVRSGKLCSSNLYRLRFEDNRVFKRKREEEQLNTAITLLIDCSGSMTGGRDKCAISAAYLFAKVLEHLQIPCEVLGFSTGNDYFSGKGRSCSVKVGVFKLFKEKLTSNVLGRFCYFYKGGRHEKYHNCNDDGESILMALTHLAERNEQRKILFVMSDGQPNSDGCHGEEWTHLKNVTKMIEQMPGYEVYGIGIQTRAVEKFYSHYSVLDNPEDLSKVIIEQLSKNIL